MPEFITLNSRQAKVIEILLKNKDTALQSSAIHEHLAAQGEDVSLVTVKRLLSELEVSGVFSISGSGRATAYSVTNYGRLIFPVEAGTYCSVEPDKRYGSKGFNFEIFDLAEFDPLTAKEHAALDAATKSYQERIHGLSPAIEEKELERFIIELSWKSSKIEGNTYTLLDTEKLLVRGIEAPGHDRSEARMILNHKEAFKFIRDNVPLFLNLSRANIEKVHSLLVRDLNVNYGLRSKPVGVTGSIYRPLDNIHQIADAIYSLCETVSKMQTPYAKALLTLLGLSYIRPFEDGNKRTARLMASAILLAHSCAPLSYRSVDENDYREAMLVFYELNSLVPFKKIFIEQYNFATENYLVHVDYTK
jgi:fido (protein-threonine AMPylation protein)